MDVGCPEPCEGKEYMKRIIVALLIPLLLSVVGSVAAEEKISKSDSATVQEKKELYIPKDLEDCFVQLKKMLDPSEIENIKAGTEDDIIRYHFSLGMWMRNNWKLWGGSRLATWFNTQGIEHPDDMSGIILDSFWRHINQKPIKLDEQVKYYQEYWKEQERSQATDL